MGDQVWFTYYSDHRAALAISSETGASFIQADFSQAPDGIPDIDDNHFDVLVNNAAVNISRVPIQEVAVGDLGATLAVNVIAPFCLIQKVLPGMCERKRGRIVNINSIYGQRGSRGNGPYTIAKHGLSGLTKTVALEYGSAGITCNEILPGAVESALLNRIAEYVRGVTGEAVESYIYSLEQRTPTHRLTRPEDVAGLAIFLCSERGSQVNGTSIALDGGYTL
jgi:NAD(P)-dependent dehydrogenase (short-subunit alcohol dehydrogenase family)